MRYWRISGSVIPWMGYVKGSLLAGLLAVPPAIGFIPAVQAAGDYGDVSDYSCYQLWYERNSIYAEKGYCFKTAKARAVFGRGCFPPYGHLSTSEREHVAGIEEWEHRKGCR
jgi:hypothetical protein